MNTLSNSSAEPSYIARLALNSAPFNSKDTPTFFQGEQIEQRLNLLVHLARSSDKVGLLIAEKGVGKSALLTQVKLTAGDDLRICHIDTADMATPIIEQCLQAFGIDDEELQQSSEHNSLLRSRLQRLRKLNIRPLLLVDNIDSITPDNLAILMDLFSWQDDDEFLLQAILTSSQTLPELDNIHGRLQRVDLPSLTENELTAYLMQRLEAVGYKGELPFSAKELKQLYRQSQGKPASVNHLAHQQLLGLKLNTTSMTEGRNPSGIASVLRWLAIIILAVSLTLLLIFQDKVNSLFTSPAEEKDIIEQPFGVDEEILSTVIIDDNGVISIDKTTLNDEQFFTDVLPLVENLEDDPSFSETLNNAIDMEQAERDELTLLVADLPIIEQEDSSVINNEPRDIIDVAVIDDDKLTDTPTVNIENPVYKQDWIQQQQSTHYTFQLMGAWEYADVAEFIDKYALTGDIAVFQSDRNGRVWHALIYGVYENKKEALQASKDWPKPLNTLPSWLRRFDSVQQQIKNTE